MYFYFIFAPLRRKNNEIIPTIKRHLVRYTIFIYQNLNSLCRHLLPVKIQTLTYENIFTNYIYFHPYYWR
jgi:hypothetical protein